MCTCVDVWPFVPKFVAALTSNGFGTDELTSVLRMRTTRVVARTNAACRCFKKIVNGLHVTFCMFGPLTDRRFGTSKINWSWLAQGQVPIGDLVQF